MTSLRLHRERYQVELAPARSGWFVAGQPGQQGSLGRGLSTVSGGCLPCSMPASDRAIAPRALGFVTKNLEEDR